MESALGLIAEKGIQGLTIKNLSKKIGISEPAIYRHFDSKSSILDMRKSLLLSQTFLTHLSFCRLSAVFDRFPDVFYGLL